MAKRDYYEILGVERTADDQALKSAYRRLAHRYHPDKNPGDKAAEEAFKEVSEAYEALSNPDRRAAYDRFGHASERMGGVPDPFAGGSIHDIFGDFFDVFGGGSRRGRPRSPRRRGEDMRYNLEISFEEAAFGTEAKLRIPRHRRCDACKGSGAREGTSPRTCPQCGGAGEVRLSQGFFSMVHTCPACRGEGRFVAEPCPGCRGTGRLEHEAALSVKVPQGVDAGTRLKISGEGEPGEHGGPAGDLYVVLSVREHALFSRQDDDVICELPVSFTQAALGGKVEVPTLDGRVELAIPAGTQPGKVFHLRGRGVPHLNGPGRGDQHVQVTVEVPRHLTRRQKELLEQFAATMGESQTPARSSFFDKMRQAFGGDDAGGRPSGGDGAKEQAS